MVKVHPGLRPRLYYKMTAESAAERILTSGQGILRKDRIACRSVIDE